MVIRNNHIKELYNSGEVALGGGAASFSPEVVEMFGSADLDFVWLDMEHGGPSPYNSRILESITRSATLSNIEPLVRIPSTGAPNLIRKVIDAGIRTVLIPRIEDPEQVREAVKASKFVYNNGPGERGAGGWSKKMWNGSSKAEIDYTEHEDNNTLIGVQIETKTAMENIGEIVSVPELGFVKYGRNDLATSMGYPMDIEKPEVQRAFDEIESIILDAEPIAMYTANTFAEAKSAIEDGFRVIKIGSEHDAVDKVLGKRRRRLKGELHSSS